MKIVLVLISFCISMLSVCEAAVKDVDNVPFRADSTYDSNTSSVPDAVKIPAWIKQQKIRAGWLYADDDPSNAILMSQNGFNTVIVFWSSFKEGDTWNDTIQKYTNWAAAGKNNNLHIFISFAWMPRISAHSFLTEFVYRHAVFADGTVSVAVCPLDTAFWTNHMNRVGKAIATLSIDPNLTIDGIFLDSELYGTEQKRIYERDYGLHACFCDHCFSEFLISKGYTSSQFPRLGASKRQNWLQSNGMSKDYLDFLKARISSLAATFKSEIRQINPKLILGMYPTLTSGYGLGENWVRESIARAWGTVDFPMVLFATDTYYTGGYRRIPDNPINLYRQSGINIVYCAGYLLRLYGSNDLETNLYESARRADGYWIFQMSQLWKSSEVSKLYQGTPSMYLRSISNANNSIKMLN